MMPWPLIDPSGFVGLLAVDPLIGRAVGAQAVFDVFDEPEGDAALFFPGAGAYRALDAPLRHLTVFIGYCCHVQAILKMIYPFPGAAGCPET